MSGTDPTGTPAYGAPSPGPGDASSAPRPTRAELRRAREAGAPVEAVATSTASDVSRDGRAQQRRSGEQRGRGAPRRSVLTAWWFVPLLVLVALAAYLGVKSATPSGVQTPGVVVSSGTAAP